MVEEVGEAGVDRALLRRRDQCLASFETPTGAGSSR